MKKKIPKMCRQKKRINLVWVLQYCTFEKFTPSPTTRGEGSNSQPRYDNIQKKTYMCRIHPHSCTSTKTNGKRIDHHKVFHIQDIIANYYCKTPTKVSEFFSTFFSKFFSYKFWKNQYWQKTFKTQFREKNSDKNKLQKVRTKKRYCFAIMSGFIKKEMICLVNDTIPMKI